MKRLLIADFQKRFAGQAGSCDTVIDAQLEVPLGKFSTTVLFGPSGCGKTTVLRSLAGLERPELGKITFDDEVWLDSDRGICRSPQLRGIGFCFQQFALFPQLTVAANIGYGLAKDVTNPQQLTAEMVERFQLNGLEKRFPHQLSGGQQQRVALARALIRRPRLLLLDEPLSALDSTLRIELRGQLRQLLCGFNIPVVLVTHDHLEALSLSDQVVVLDHGRVLQCGSSDDVFSRPADPTVATIVGVETVQYGEISELSDGMTTINVGNVRLVANVNSIVKRKVWVGIRSENVQLIPDQHPNQNLTNLLTGTIQHVAPEGGLVRLTLDCGFPLVAQVPKRRATQIDFRPGARVTVQIAPSDVHLMSANDPVLRLPPPSDGFNRPKECVEE